MNISDPYLVLGMHRSGTSYLAGLLQTMGVSMGDELVEANEGNPRGHFEDKTILNIHKHWLAANEESGHAFDDGMMRQSSILTKKGFDTKELKAFLETKKGKKQWGWKEPRSCLFLTYWLKQFPGMKGLVVFRHPLEVNASMLRRGHWDYGIFPHQVYRAYALYNQNILSLLDQKAESFLCLNANEAFGNHDDLISRIEAKFPDLSMEGDTNPFYAKEFRSLEITPAIHDCCKYLFPEAVEAFDRLNQLADVPFVFSQPRDDESQFIEFKKILERFADHIKGDAMFHAGLIYQFESLLWSSRDPSLKGTYELIQDQVSEEIRSLRHMGVEWKQMSVCIEEMTTYVAELEKHRDELIEERDKLWSDQTKLGETWDKQTAYVAELEKHRDELIEERDKLWSDQTKLGETWDKQTTYVAELEKYRDELIEERDKLWSDQMTLGEAWDEKNAYVAELEKRRDELWQKLVNLGDSWENQKAHIKKISEQRDHFWADLVKVGKSWEEKEAHIHELEALLKKSEARCEALEKNLKSLNKEDSSVEVDP